MQRGQDATNRNSAREEASEEAPEEGKPRPVEGKILVPTVGGLSELVDVLSMSCVSLSCLTQSVPSPRPRPLLHPNLHNSSIPAADCGQPFGRHCSFTCSVIYVIYEDYVFKVLRFSAGSQLIEFLSGEWAASSTSARRAQAAPLRPQWALRPPWASAGTATLALPTAADTSSTRAHNMHARGPAAQRARGRPPHRRLSLPAGMCPWHRRPLGNPESEARLLVPEPGPG